MLAVSAARTAVGGTPLNSGLPLKRAKAMRCITCGNEIGFLESKLGLSYPLVCSRECLNVARDSYAAILPDDALDRVFPLIRSINIHANVFGGCQGEDWDQVLAHAHTEDDIICVRGPITDLFEKDGKPTSLLLHEYAHLRAQAGHTDEFWAENKQLHADFGVMHKQREEALGYVVVGVLLGGLILSLGLVFGVWAWWFAIGWVVFAVFAVPVVINSFRAEQVEIAERECGTKH